MANNTNPVKPPGIDDQYRNLLEAQKTKLDADYENSRRQYESQLTNAAATYEPLRNEAYVNNALAEKARKENMANMGLSGEGGTSLSLQQRNEGNKLSTLGDVSRQERSFMDEANLGLAGLETTYNANVSSVTSDIEAQKIAAQLAQNQFDQNFAVSEQQLKVSQGDAKLSEVMALRKAGLITKAEAREMLDWTRDTGFNTFLDNYFS